MKFKFLLLQLECLSCSSIRLGLFIILLSTIAFQVLPAEAQNNGSENKMSGLYGLWDNHSETLTITRANGQKYKVNGRQILSGSHKVFGVETIGDQVHVLTGPTFNQGPNRRVKFDNSGSYKGSSAL